MRLENDLPHQLNAVNAVCGVFAGVEFFPSPDRNKCAKINLQDPIIKRNISDVQSGKYYVDNYSLPDYYKQNHRESGYLNIDVKMETGTGKTYVYTRTMFELHKNYGVNKFMVLVPTVSIKEGAKAFLTSGYMRSDLQSLYGGTELFLHCLDAQKAVKGRKAFPLAISEFANGADVGGNRIDVLLINSGMLTSKATMGAHYDQTLLGTFTQPYETLREISPFVIVDEPHKFNRTQKTFKCLAENINPQCVIRYGATFPQSVKGVYDYENVVYNLGSCDAFNDNLVKGVEVEYIAEEAKLKDSVKIKVLSITCNKTQGKSVKFQNEATKKSYELIVGQSLAEIDDELTGITVEGIEKSGVTLSNGAELHVSDAIYPQVFAETFQTTMLSLALDRHFDKERENFKRANRIKTLSLFFIDSIDSFRSDGYLRTQFEELLKYKLEKEIKKLSASSGKEAEYREYLEYSLKNIPSTIAAYFSEDNNTDSEEVKAEVDKVLRAKDKIIRIRDEKGNFEPTRFIFSKWTLKEGWDNPNVFVIAKLRSSGSETSKLQEVGRGLRLPVDEFGNRISGEQTYLRYIIDYSEKDFADKLKKEINGDAGRELKITKSFLENYAKKKHIDVNQFLLDILFKRYVQPIDFSIIEENKGAFAAEYPDLFKSLANGKIIEINRGSGSRLNVRRGVFEKLEELWSMINRKYYIGFEDMGGEELKRAVVSVLNKNVDALAVVTTKIARSQKDEADGSVGFKEAGGTSLTVKKSVMPYGEFLKVVQKRTGIPVKIMHAALCEYFKDSRPPEEFFSKQTLQKFVDYYRLWFISYYADKYFYERLNVSVSDPLRDADGKLKKTVVKGDVGVFNSNADVPQNYLYDECCYDAQLEKDDILTGVDNDVAEVKAFGKIPKRTVRIPTYADGTYSPDFMYSIKTCDGRDICLIVECKDKEIKKLDPEDLRKIACAQKLFEKMRSEGEEIYYRSQLKNQSMTEIIKQLL